MKSVLTVETFNLDCISRALRRANTCIWLDTCFRVRVFPVLSLIYRAINSFRPKIQNSYLKKGRKKFKIWIELRNGHKLATIDSKAHVLNTVGHRLHWHYISSIKSGAKKRKPAADLNFVGVIAIIFILSTALTIGQRARQSAIGLTCLTFRSYVRGAELSYSWSLNTELRLRALYSCSLPQVELKTEVKYRRIWAIVRLETDLN